VSESDTELFGEDELVGKTSLYVVEPCPAENLKKLLEDRLYFIHERGGVHGFLMKTRKNIASDFFADDELYIHPSDERVLASARVALQSITKKVQHLCNKEDFTSDSFQEQQRSLAKLQRLGLYYVQLVDANVKPEWCITDALDLRELSTLQMDKLFRKQDQDAASEPRDINARLDETMRATTRVTKLLSDKICDARLALFDQPQEIARCVEIFHHTFFLRTLNELAYFLFNPSSFEELPFKTIVSLICFIYKQSEAFQDVLHSHSLTENNNTSQIVSYFFPHECFLERVQNRMSTQVLFWITSTTDFDNVEAIFQPLFNKCRLDVTGKNYTNIPEDLLLHLEENFAYAYARIGDASTSIFFKGMSSSFLYYPSLVMGIALSMLNSGQQDDDRLKTLLFSLLNDISRLLYMNLLPNLLENDAELSQYTENAKQELYKVGLLALSTLIDLLKAETVRQWEVFFSRAWQGEGGDQVAQAACTELMMTLKYIKQGLQAVPFFDSAVALLIEYALHLYMGRFLIWCEQLEAMFKKVSSEDISKICADIAFFEKVFGRFGQTSKGAIRRFNAFYTILQSPFHELFPKCMSDIMCANAGAENEVHTFSLQILLSREDLQNRTSKELNTAFKHCKDCLDTTCSVVATFNKVMSDVGEIPSINAFTWVNAFATNKRFLSLAQLMEPVLKAYPKKMCNT